MASLGHILVADDEELCLRVTADMLRRGGYECSCAPDGPTAARMLGDREYDLVIADINMPGNSELEFVRELPHIANHLPVILMTGYPSVESAIESLHLPVAAYLLKPVEMSKLLGQVKTAVAKSRLRRAVLGARQRADEWRQELAGMGEALEETAPTSVAAPLDVFIDLSIRNAVGTLLDLKQVTDTLDTGAPSQEACHLFNCPKLRALSRAVDETLATLAKTRRAFKSKELGRLHRKLKGLVGT